MTLHILDVSVLGGTWTQKGDKRGCKRRERSAEEEKWKDEEERAVRGKGGQYRREEELLRVSRAVNILQAWIREVMK